MHHQTKIRIFRGYWTEADVKRHTNCLFVYGDNDVGKGRGGQAIIRDLANTTGIPTKKYPSNTASAFYTDAELAENKIKIQNAINKIIELAPKYKFVILPADGFGTGLADLPRLAPKTFEYLVQSVNKLKNSI
jgi:hypothetical protein